MLPGKARLKARCRLGGYSHVHSLHCICRGVSACDYPVAIQYTNVQANIFCSIGWTSGCTFALNAVMMSDVIYMDAIFFFFAGVATLICATCSITVHLAWRQSKHVFLGSVHLRSQVISMAALLFAVFRNLTCEVARRLGSYLLRIPYLVFVQWFVFAAKHHMADNSSWT